MEPKTYYDEKGYFIFPNLIPASEIDRLLNFYVQDIVTSPNLFFRQNTNKYESNRVNEFGFVEQSFLDVHDYKEYPEFSEAAKQIACGDRIMKALSQLTDFNSFNLMQTMIFDANTETCPHQDWWYIDSVPNGHLIAAWIALEDIDEKAGRFYVLPKSMKEPNFHRDIPNLSHSEWLQKIKKYTELNQDDIKAPGLKKGDVLFWNSKLIHGALPTIDPSFSRRSLTCHYLPSQYKFGNLFTTKEYIKYQTYQGIKIYKNQPEYSLVNEMKYKIKFLAYDRPILLKYMRKLQKALS